MPRLDHVASFDLLTPDVVWKIAIIHEHKGKQELYLQARPDVLALITRATTTC